MNIVTDGSQVAVARSVNNKCLVTSTEEVPNDLVAMIEPGGVGAQKPLHASDQIGTGCFQHEVKMIGHEHEGMNLPLSFCAGLGQRFEKHDPVLVVIEDGFLSITTTHDVIDRSWILDTRPPCHNAILRQEGKRCQKLRFIGTESIKRELGLERSGSPASGLIVCG